MPKFDFSEIKQFKAEKKTYAVDTGMLRAVEFKMSSNYGKLLENAVLLELVKAGREIYYYKNKSECDFLVRHRDGTLIPLQVTWEMNDPDTFKREINGISVVCEELSLSKGLMVTFDKKDEFEVNNIKIMATPFYEWAYELRI